MTPEQKRKQLLLMQEQARLRSQFPQPEGGVSTDSQAVGEFQDKVAAAVDGAHNGITFGFGDELAGAKGALAGQNTRDDGTLSRDYSGSMGDRYRSERDKYREQQAASQQNEPTMHTAGNIGGAMVPALAAAPLSGGGSLLGTMGRGVVAGGIEGGLHGAGNADGKDVLSATGQGAMVGAIAGGAAPAVVKGASMAKNAVKDPITGVADALMNRANTGKANRAIIDTMKAGKKSPDEIGQMVMQAAQEGQPEFRMMDAMGVAGQRRASGITRAGGEPGSAIAEYLAKRQQGQGERVAGFVDEGFGLSGSTAKQTKDSLTAARAEAANTAYDAARGNAAPVDVRGALAVIDDRIGGMKGSGVTGDSIDSKLSGYRSRLAADPAPNGEISRELSDFDRVLGVKQDIQDDIGAAARAGRDNEARELRKLLSKLDSALEQSSDMYRTANDGFREASKTIDAVDQGQQMSRPSARAADTVPQFQGMTPDQQGAARVGYGDNLLSKIESNTSPTANKSKILQSPKRDAEATAMTVDPDLYGRRLSRENDMWETQNRALGGSRTADNLEDIADTGEIASGMGGAARSLANLQVGDALAKAGGALAPMAKGQNEATRELIARALMSNNPQEALAPALRQDMSSQAMRRILEAMLRNSGREGYSGSVQ
ncbi:hypothetical protein JQV19_08385 [Sulfitobacter mediterraneus]|uniref:hypothetical protein n=1 Tax=Sulfitobacter mediterraneus TaxID=83219 RepID=UPI001939C4EC|nr:hypothetical protein [Sulfitobacter mediterraneus]MBM1556663.1 hypothetical protein [Sulfitobacter mediterraneus]MBM1570140.1 hypothetical protein [Sulfitobacter mediterraneus]MBM1574097.1 hypothetical protein [Sulfitobacter mediterraneus]MBM1577882.1 hypothetical protein [Sulfitobacter mediterraneus]MBM1579621.1 hypothetical protein [Sulfitobacter mediterraneus]